MCVVPVLRWRYARSDRVCLLARGRGPNETQHMCSHWLTVWCYDGTRGQRVLVVYGCVLRHRVWRASRALSSPDPPLSITQLRLAATSTLRPHATTPYCRRPTTPLFSPQPPTAPLLPSVHPASPLLSPSPPHPTTPPTLSPHTEPPQQPHRYPPARPDLGLLLRPRRRRDGGRGVPAKGAAECGPARPLW